MRLLLSDTVELGQFNETPPYAILSHTWGDESEEVIFQDMIINNASTTDKPGYQKVRNICSRTAADGLDHVWIDACCIDKTSSAELSEALNSMYYWYQQAEVCYVYLVDVPSGSDNTTFSKSRWFMRGWTLQELIAPSNMIFLSSDWQEIGTKSDLRELISEITGIPINILLGDDPGLASVAQRMSWAANRVTKKVEDRAYSLMGLFGVNMPLLYGERDRAFIRLQEEIMKGSNDQSIFAWTSAEDYGGPLATSPAAFANSRDIVPVDPSNTIGNHPVISNQGVQLTAPFMGIGEEAVGLVMLNCTNSNRGDLFVAIYLRDVSLTMRHFERARRGELELVNPKTFNSLIYPARQLYIRSERPKKRVMSERPEICVIDLQGAETDNVYFQSIWELSNGTLAASIPPIDAVFGRILILSSDGVLYRIVLSRIKGSLSAELVTGSKSREKLSPGQTTGCQLKNKTSETSKEVARKTHVSVAIQKRQRQEKLLWTVRISYTSPRRDTNEGVQFRHMMVLDKDTEDNELLFAAGHGLEEVVILLLSRKDVNVNCKDGRGRTPILRAAEGGHINVFRLLIQNGAEPESVDNEGQSALHYSAANGHTGIFSLLLARGTVDVNLNDKYWWTPLAHAAAKGRYPIVQLLLDQPSVRTDTKDKCQRTPLLHAAREGHTVIVELLLKSGSDPNIEDQKEKTALLLAASKGHVKILRKLLTAGNADVNTTNEGKRTPLHVAAENGHISIIQELCKARKLTNEQGVALLKIAASNGHAAVVKELLVTQKIDIHTTQESESAVLHLAVRNGHKDVVKEFLTDTRINPDSRDVNGTSPLHAAVRNGHIGVVCELLATGKVHADSKNMNGMTALQLAAYHGNAWLVWLLLIRKDVDINYQQRVGLTALRLAVQNGHGAVVRLLLSTARVDPDVRDIEGKTPLSLAASQGHGEIVAQLLESGRVDPDVRDSEGTTPLSSAASQGHGKIVAQLLESGRVDPGSRDNAQTAPLVSAATNGYAYVIKQLLESGRVDPNSRDADGITPLWLAANAGHQGAVRALLETGKCDPNAKDKMGMTPLHMAVSKGYTEIVRQLVATGRADPWKRDFRSRAPIQLAKKLGHAEIVKELEACPRYHGNEGSPPPYRAVEDSHIGVMKELRDTGSVNDDKKVHKRTLLERIHLK